MIPWWVSIRLRLARMKFKIMSFDIMAYVPFAHQPPFDDVSQTH